MMKINLLPSTKISVFVVVDENNAEFDQNQTNRLGLFRQENHSLLEQAACSLNRHDAENKIGLRNSPGPDSHLGTDSQWHIHSQAGNQTDMTTERQETYLDTQTHTHWRSHTEKHVSDKISQFNPAEPQPPQRFYGPFSGTIWVSQCQKRTSGLHGARED